MLPLVLASALMGTETKPCPMVSSVQTSPDGLLTGALLWKPEPAVRNDDELFPEAIVLLKRGTYWKEIPSPGIFAWHWLFWQGSSKIAVDASPLHYVQSLTLVSTANGRVIEGDGPEPNHILSAWAQALVDQESADAKEAQPHQDCRFRHKQRRGCNLVYL